MKRKFFFITFMASAVPFISLWAIAGPNPHNGSKCLLCHMETPRLGVDTKETVTFRKATSDDPVLCTYCHRPE